MTQPLTQPWRNPFPGKASEMLDVPPLQARSNLEVRASRLQDRRVLNARWDQASDGLAALTSTGLATAGSSIAASVDGTNGDAIFPIWGARKEFRSSFRVTCTKATASSRSTVGFTVSTPGTLPTTGNFAFGIGYLQGTGIAVVRDNVGAANVIVADTSIADGDQYDISIWTDVVLSARGTTTGSLFGRVVKVSDGTTSYSTTNFTIASFAVNNVLIRTNVAAGALTNIQISNHPLGAIGLRGSGVVPYTATGGAVENAYLHLPANPNGKLVLALHGHGDNPTSAGQTFTNYAGTWTALVNAGYTVALPLMGGDLWGNTAAQARLIELQAQLVALYDLEPEVFIHGNSMGGGAGATLISDRPFPIRAAYMAQPAVDYDTISANPSYATINTAYTTTALRDASNPLKRAASTYAGVPVVIVASPSDTAIPKASNGDALAALISGSTFVRQVTASGNHNDPSMFIPKLTVDWFRLHG